MICGNPFTECITLGFVCYWMTKGWEMVVGRPVNFGKLQRCDSLLIQIMSGPLCASRCALTFCTVPSGLMVMESSRRETGRKPSMPSVRCAQRATERETLERRASAKSAFDGPCGLLSRCAPSRACVLLAVVNSMGAGPEGWLLRA